MRRFRFLLGAILVGLVAATPAGGRAAEPVDLALVLAVDVSSSINDGEFRLQMQGHAEAFLNRQVLHAITSGRHKRIVATMVQWSNLHDQQQVVPWTVIASAEDAGAFSRAIAGAPRAVAAGSTSISGAIEYARRLMRTMPYDAGRRVIDISGDGLNNMGPHPSAIRDRAVADGIVVNGLAILTEVLALDVYYEDNVIGGTGAFAVAAPTYAAFGEAVLKKLIREIVGGPSGPSLAELP